MDISKEAREKISRLQLIEQNMQQLMLQKQQLQAQAFELENALKQIGATEQAYKIIGNVMVAATKEDLKKDLTQKKEVIDLRLSNVEKQEKQLKERAQKLQEEVLSTMKK